MWLKVKLFHMNHFNWSPGIGDPTIMGWLTVLLYLLASLSCWQLTGSLKKSAPARQNEIKIWLSIAILFLALGINKQLDLQSAMTELGRVLAHIYGWYESRRAVQLVFIIVIAGVCLALAITLGRWMRDGASATWLAVIGTTLLLGFIVVRAASFHHFDQFINDQILGLRWNWILEIGAITMVLFASHLRARTMA